MQSYASPIVCAQFVAIGAPLDSFGVTAWHDVPAPIAAPIAERAAAPSIGRVTARAVPESVIAWRARHYAFRAARSRVIAGDVAAALEILAGPHGDYVRTRSSELADTDARFSFEARSEAPAAAPRARVDTPEQSSPIDSPPIVNAPIVAPPVDRVPAGGVIIQRTAMTKALRSLMGAIPAKVPAKPGVPEVATKRLRLWTVGDVLRVGALDFPAVPTVDIAQVQVDRPFAVGVIAGKVLLDIFALSNDDVLSLAVEGSEVHVRGADSHYKLVTAPIPAALPDLVAPVDADAHWMTTTAGQLAEVIRMVEFACAKAQTRYAFNAIALEFNRDRCDVVTTDGRRLMVQQLAGDVRPAASGVVLVDRRYAKALRRALMNLAATAPVHVCVVAPPAGASARRLAVIGPALEWRGDEVEATYPSWREVLPAVDASSPRYTFDVEALAAAVKRASTMTSEDCKGLRFEFDVAGRGRVQLVSRNPENGETIAFCQAIDATGEPFSRPIAFNPAFIGEALRTAKRGKVTLALTAPNRPGLFAFDYGARYVLMPVNFQ